MDLKGSGIKTNNITSHRTETSDTRSKTNIMGTQQQDREDEVLLWRLG